MAQPEGSEAPSGTGFGTPFSGTVPAPPVPRDQVFIQTEPYRGLLVGSWVGKAGKHLAVHVQLDQKGSGIRYCAGGHTLEGVAIEDRNANRKVPIKEIIWYDEFRHLTWNRLAELAFQQQVEDGYPPLRTDDWVMYNAKTMCKWTDKDKMDGMLRQIMAREDTANAYQSALYPDGDSDEEGLERGRTPKKAKGKSKKRARMEQEQRKRWDEIEREMVRGNIGTEGSLSDRPAKKTTTEAAAAARAIETVSSTSSVGRSTTTHNSEPATGRPVLEWEGRAVWREGPFNPMDTVTLVRIDGRRYVRYLNYHWLGYLVAIGAPTYPHLVPIDGRLYPQSPFYQWPWSPVPIGAPTYPPRGNRPIGNGYQQTEQEDPEIPLTGRTNRLDSMATVVINGAEFLRMSYYVDVTVRGGDTTS
ncbi:MAG: tyrosine protein phosphatase yvh1 [Watsoniomyces obsoletus]|nr:MAG: tyrosine protein phosphatase yvh1 [Watsoniomyces obsoletus]